MSHRIVVSSQELTQVLVERGIVPANCRRIVIDIEAQKAPVIHYETFADERILEVFRDPRVRIEGPAKE